MVSPCPGVGWLVIAAGGAVEPCSVQSQLVGTSGHAESHGLQGVWQGSRRQHVLVEGCSGPTCAIRRSNDGVWPDRKIS